MKKRRAVKGISTEAQEEKGPWWTYSGNMVFVRDGVIFGVRHGFCVFLDSACVVEVFDRAYLWSDQGVIYTCTLAVTTAICYLHGLCFCIPCPSSSGLSLRVGRETSSSSAPDMPEIAEQGRQAKATRTLSGDECPRMNGSES